ncbi:MAG: hypothetical protein ACLS8Y_08705 [Lachnospira sp.]
MDEYNKEPFQKRSGSRFDIWKDEKQYLRQLPATPYEAATEVLKHKVYPNCHV